MPPVGYQHRNRKPTPKRKPPPLQSAWGGFGAARDVQAGQRRAVTTQQARGFGGARDVAARQAAKTAYTRSRGFGGARDTQARTARKVAARRARGFGGAADRLARDADLKRRLTNQYAYLLHRSEQAGGYGEREMFGRPTETIADLRRGIRILDSQDPYATVRGMQLQRADLAHNRLVKALRPVTDPAAELLEYTLRPVHAVAAAAKSDVAEIQRKGLLGAIGGGQGARAAGRGITGKDKTLFSDVLAQAGVKNPIVKGLGGFALDVALDPTTYLTGGASSIGRRTLLKGAQGIQRTATAAKAEELTRSIATRIRTGELTTRGEIRAARKAAREESREYGRTRARAWMEQRRTPEGRRRALKREHPNATDEQIDKMLRRQDRRGIKISIAGSRQRAAAKQARASRISRRQIRKLVSDPSAQVKRAAKPRALPPLLRDLDVKATAKLGQIPGALGVRSASEHRAARFLRAAGAGAHADVRPVGISGREFADIKAVKRESRAKAERLTRRAAARANALLGHLEPHERQRVIDAIENDDIASLSADAIRARLKARHPGASTSMIEDMLRDEVVAINRVKKSTVGDRAIGKVERRLRSQGYSEAEIAERVAGIKTGPVGRIPIAKGVRGQAGRAPFGVKGKRLSRRTGRVKVPVGVRRSLSAQAARDPNRLHRVASDVQSELRYIEREARRSGILSGRVGSKSRTREEARIGAKTKAPTRREEAAQRSQVKLLGELLGEAQSKAKDLKQPERPGGAWFKPRPNAKRPQPGRGYIDEQGKLHTWNESEGTHAETARARGHKRYESIIIDPEGHIEAGGGGGLNLFENETIARVLLQDSRLKPPRNHDLNSRPIDQNGKTYPSVNDEIKRLRGEYPAKATPASKAADKEVQRIGKLLDQARERVTEIPQRRAEAAAYAHDVRRTKRQRLQSEAKGYFPRASREEAEGTRELAEVEGRVPETYRQGAHGTTEPPPTKRRELRSTRAQMSRGSDRERAAFENLSDDVRNTLALYGSQMARGMGAALRNREIAESGRALPKNLGGGSNRENARAALKKIEDGGEKVYFLHRGRLIPVDTSDRREFAKLIRSTRTHGVGGQRKANAGLGGRYVLLRPQVVHQAQKEGRMLGADTALGKVIDVPQRGFKTGALLTPGYLVRNLLGDLWNSHTEESVFHLARNFVRGQKALNALGRYERGLRNFRKSLPQSRRTIKLTEEQASEFARHMGRSGTPKREVDAMEVALLAERAGVVRQGRFTELMEEGRGLRPRTPSAWHDLSKRVEDSIRISTFLGGLQHGQTPREAAARATKVHFDYADLTTAEKTVARRVMPFYTFSARNLPLQAKTFVTKPGKFANVEKAREEGRRSAGLPEHYERALNPYEARQLGIPVKFGGKTYTVSAGSPFVDLNDIASAAQGPAGLLQTGTRRVEEMSGPWKTVPELLAGKEGYSAFFREPIRREEEPTTRAPEWAAWLGRKFPEFAQASNMTQEYAPPEGGRGPGWDKKWDYAFRQLQIGPVNSLVELAGLGVKKGLNARQMGKVGRILTDFGIRAPETTSRRREIQTLYDEREKINDEQTRLRRQYKPGTDERISADNPTPRYTELGEAKSRVEKRLNKLLTAERPEGFVAGERVRPKISTAPSGRKLPPLQGPRSGSGVALPPLR